MRKKLTKALALVCALCMLAPATTPAYAADSSSYDGDSIIETDNSTAPKLSRVVLPTIAEDTYNFKIDVEGLLKTFDPTNYDAAANIYFLAENNAATLAVAEPAAGTTYTFVVKGIAPVADSTSPADGTEDEVLAYVTGKEVSAFNTAGLYVWQPDAEKNNGEGKYTPVTSANYATFFDVTLDADNKISVLTYKGTPLAGDVETIWDGKVYEVSYTALDDGEEAAAYYDAEEGTFDASLYVKAVVTESASTTYVKPVTGTAGDGQVKLNYTAATTKYTNKTNAATITNKSTFNIGVIADVSMTADGLTFVNKAAIDTAKDAAEIYVGIANAADAANDVAYVTTAAGANTAKAAFVIPGTGATANIYQTEDTNEITGGHIYHQYLAPVSTYSSAAFVITAGADTTYKTDADVKALWDAYVASLDDADKKPVISIVYRFLELKDDGAADGSDWTYAATNNAEFTITGATSKLTAADWATYDTTNVVKVTASVADSKGTVDKTTAEVGEVITVTPNITAEGKMAGTASVAYHKTGDTTGSPSGTITDIALNSAGKYAITVPSDAITGTFVVTIAEVDKVGFDKLAYEYTAGTATTVTVYPTDGEITKLYFLSASGAEKVLTETTDYTISDNVITLLADTGLCKETSDLRKSKANGDLVTTLHVVVGGESYEADFTIHPAP